MESSDDGGKAATGLFRLRSRATPKSLGLIIGVRRRTSLSARYPEGVTRSRA